MNKEQMQEFATMVATAVLEGLEKRNPIPPTNSGKTAYQKTEQLLYNYNGFKRIIAEKEAEIDSLRRYGVPKRSASIVEYTPRTGTVHGIVLEEESVDAAIRSVQASVEGTVQAVTLINKGLEYLNSDPYYRILPMRYFDGRTQEDIAEEFGCSQVTISKNKNRLIKELSIRLFPNQAVAEMMQ